MGQRTDSTDQRLDRRVRDALVGRDGDLHRLGRVLGDDGPLVVFLHGIAGVGKSALLARFVADAADAGATALPVDCRLIEPTERGFLAELGRLTGDEVACLEDAVGALVKIEARAVLVLDDYDSFLLMDTWLRRVFLPAMPANVRLVIAGRRRPVPQWLTAPRWHGLIVATAVEPLDEGASRALLAAAGLKGDAAGRLAAVAHGNPLALTLGAAAARDRTMALGEAAVEELMPQLTALFLDDVTDPAVRDALRSVCVARRITRSLLRAFSLEDEELFEALRALPFVDVRRDGLCLHDAVREALARTLKASDPQRYHACRRRVWRQLRAEVRAVPGTEIWRYTADMLFLVENPVVREAFFPSGGRALAVESSCAADEEALQAIARRHDGAAGAEALAAWWALRPDAFRTVRDGDDRPVGFYCMAVATDLPAAVRRADPLADAWFRHLEAEPLAETGKCLFVRRWLAAGAGEAPSPEQAACWLDVKRAYMELRPALQRVYLTVADLAPYAEVATRLGFRPLPEAAVDLGERSFQTAVLDFGPASVDGWITRLVGEELGVRDGGPLDRDRCALVLDGEEVPLTPLEFGLLDYLESLDGATATRDAILEAVWDQEAAATGSNVVDAVVKSLRRKLGAEAGRVETVRGFGYRWRCD